MAVSWSMSDLPEQDPLVEHARRGLASRFEIQETLGSGSFGAVFRARERSSGRELAVKVLRRGDQRAKSRFVDREGALTAALDHPGIVRIHSGGELSGLSYLAYELIEGAQPLRLTRGEGALEEFLGRLREVAEAVSYAHERGVVHRDLKPENVLVDGEGKAKVADFGLAWSQEVENLTLSGAFAGTPAYMAPEALLEPGSDLGKASTADVWSLGAMLYEALTGRLPFPASSLPELLDMARAGSVLPPRRVDSSIPRPLEAVCLAALHPDPKKRLPDGASFLRRLDAAIQGREEGARRGRLVIAGLLLGALGVGLALALMQTSEEPSSHASLANSQPAPSRNSLLERAARASREGDRERALELLDQVPEPPSQLVSAALLPELERLVLAGRFSEAETLADRPAARALWSRRELVAERTRLASECVLSIEAPSKREVLKAALAREALRPLTLARTLRPPSSPLSEAAQQLLYLLVRMATFGITAGSQEEIEVRVQLVVLCSDLAPENAQLNLGASGAVSVILDGDVDPALERVVRRGLALNAHDTEALGTMRWCLARVLLEADPLDEEGIRLGLESIYEPSLRFAVRLSTARSLAQACAAKRPSLAARALVGGAWLEFEGGDVAAAQRGLRKASRLVRAAEPAWAAAATQLARDLAKDPSSELKGAFQSLRQPRKDPRKAQSD